jgi:acetylornithine deacetylase/succinyl-diaminopimelate desuccinylase-like protein
MYRYKGPSYTGLVKEVDAYFPAWAIPEEDKVTQTLVEACRRNFDKAPFVDKWTFSTNGVATMGLHRIPTIGFGPGREEEAHAPNEKILKQELVEAVKVLALVPSLYEGAI